jgi:hypothetical protein
LDVTLDQPTLTADRKLRVDHIAPLKQSAEGANYESQGQAPVLQGASPLVESQNDSKR